jgi:hypothetical protein
MGICGHPVYGVASCQVCEAAVERAAKALFAIRFAEYSESWVNTNWSRNDDDCRARFREAARALRDLRR